MADVMFARGFFKRLTTAPENASPGNVIAQIKSKTSYEVQPIMKATLTLLALAGAFYFSNAQAQVIVAPPPAVVVAPPLPVVVAPPPAVAPAGVAYLAPVGVAPAPGYLWRYHVGAGWGWWHPHYGWHAPVVYHHWGYRRW